MTNRRRFLIAAIGLLLACILYAPFVIASETVPPTIAGLLDKTINEDQTPAYTFEFQIVDDTTTASVLKVSAVSSDINILKDPVTINNNGNVTISLEPVENKYGVTTVTVTVEDESRNTTQTTFNITINPVNDPPRVNDDTVLALTGTNVDINVLENDLDADIGDVLSLDSVTTPSYGTVIKYGGKISYKSSDDFVGQDSFFYTVSDSSGTTATASVRVNVAAPEPEPAVNTPPVAQNDTTSTVAGIAVPVDVLANDSDADGNALTIVSVTTPTAGEVSVTTGSIIYYTPPSDYSGDAVFSYTIEDTEGASATASVTVTVSRANRPPEANGDSATVNEDTSVDIAVLLNDMDPDGDTLSISGVGSPGHGTASAQNGIITYRPADNYNGSDSFTYVISDGKGLTSTATVSVTVTPVNDGPVALGDTAVVDEDGSVKINALSNDTDIDGDALTIAAVTTPTHGRVGITDSDKAITYWPEENYNGSDIFSYTVQDSFGAVSSATVSVTVNMVNDAPSAAADTITIDEDAVTTITVLTNDTDIDLLTNSTWESLSIVSVTTPAHGNAVITGNGKNITYTPAANYIGADGLTYTVKDRDGLTSSAVVNITINSVNDNPSAVNDSVSTDEDTAATIDVLSNDTDADLGNVSSSETLNIVSVTSPSHGTYVINSVSKTVTYTPEADYNGSDSFSYTISDAGGLTSTATVSVTVRGVNDAPSATTDTVTTLEDTAVRVDVLSNDTDADKEDNNPGDEELIITVVSNPEHGTAVIAGDKKYVTYTPSVNYNGPDNFSYVIQDKAGITSSSIVNITVEDVNDAPAAVNDTANTNEDTEKVIAVLANDTDVDLQTNPLLESLRVTAVTTPTHGSVVIAEDGKTVTYSPAANYYGSDGFSYTMADRGGIQKTASVSVTVNTVNDYPVISGLDDVYSVSEDGVLTVNFEVSDVETTTETLMIQCSSKNQTILPNDRVTLTGAGSPTGRCTLRIEPADDENGTVTVTVMLGDGFLVSQKDITINVQPVNDPPKASNDSLTFTEDTSLRFDMNKLIENDSDIDNGDTIRFAGIAYAGNLKGVLTQDTGSWYIYTPPANFDGSTSFTYYVSDGLLTSTGTVTLNAIKVNDPPVLVMNAGNPSSTPEDTEATIGFNISDLETSAKNLIVQAGSSNTAVVGPDNITINRNDSGNCSLSISPNSNSSGSTVITLSVSDGLLLSTTTCVIDVTPVDDPPRATDDSYTTVKNVGLTFDPRENDIELDREAISITHAGSTTNSTITLNNNNTITYTPQIGFAGVDKFTYTISDGHTSSTAEITVIVDRRDYSPTIHPIENHEADEDTAIGPFPFVVDNPNGGSLTYEYTSSNTDVVPQDDLNIIIDAEAKTIKIIPTPNKYGTSTIGVTVTDAEGKRHTESFTVMFFPVNDRPHINNASATVKEDYATDIDINLIAGNSDVESTTITILSVSSPLNGRLTENGNGIYTYKPYSNFNGTDSFTYTATDGECNMQASVTITVAPENDDPAAYDVYARSSYSEGAVTTITTSYYDVDLSDLNSTETITVGVVTTPTYGTASAAGNKVLYVPGANPGRDWDNFQYSITDREGRTKTATIHVFRPDAPHGIEGDGYSPIVWGEYHEINEDAAAITIDLDDNYFDPDNVSCTMTVVSAAQKGTMSVNYERQEIYYTPNQNANGNDSFNFVISDGSHSTTGTVSIYINPVNDPPSISQVGDQATNEDTPIGNIHVAISDVEKSAELLKFEVFSSNNILLPDKNISYTRSGGDIRLNLSPELNQNGTTTITVLVSDGMDMAESRFVLTVNPQNDLPQAPARNVETNEDTSVAVILNTSFADPDGDLTTLTVGTASHGSIVNNHDGTVTYTPDANYFGPDSFVYELRDTSGGTASGTVSITVLSVNDPPVFSSIEYIQSTDEDTLKSISFTVSDVDGAYPVRLDIQNSNSVLFPEGSITTSKTTAGVTDTYTLNMNPYANASGQTTVTLYAFDGAATSTVEFILKVIPINDLPAAVSDTADTLEDQKVTINVIQNDTDKEDTVLKGTTLTVVAVTNPAHGSVINNMNGTITYTPSTNYNGTDSFVYTAADSSAAQTTATVTINIAPVNDPPVANVDSVSINEDTTVTVAVLDNDRDVDSTTITLIRVDETTSKGKVEILGDGKRILYTPNLNATGLDTFHYWITDGAAENSVTTGTVNITLNPVNDAPTFVPQQTLEFNEDTVGTFVFRAGDPETPVQNLIIRLSSSNDNIVPDTSITFTGSGQDKQVKFTPKANAYGVFNLNISISDGTVTAVYDYPVTVKPVNDAPSFGDYSAATNEDTPVSGNVSGTDLETTPTAITYSLKEGFGPSNGSVTVNPNGAWVYTPNADWNGTDTFIIALNDNDTTENHPLTADGTVTVTVAPINDAPVNTVTPTITGTIAVGQTVAADTGLWNDDAEMTTTTIAYAYKWQKANDASGTGAGDISGASGNTYTIRASDAHKYIRLYVTATDNGEGTPASLSTTAVSGWMPVNNTSPVIAEGLSKAVSVNEDSNISFTLNASDDDTDAITWSISTTPTYGTASTTGTATTQTVTYKPAANYYGSDSFIVTANDGKGGTTSITVAVTVNPVNDAPVNTVTPTVTGIMLVGQVITAAAGEWNDNLDNNLSSIIYTYEWQKALTTTGTVTTITGQDSYTLTSNDAHKYIRVRVTATDNGVGTPSSQSTTATSAWVFVNNTAPVIAEGTAKQVSVDEDSNVSFSLSASDVDGDTLTWSTSTTPSSGIVTITGTGANRTVKYTPNSNYNGSDSFVVRVRDNGGSSAAITVNVTVNPVNDAPVNTTSPTISGTLKVGQAINANTGLWNDSLDKTPGNITYTYEWQEASDASGTGKAALAEGSSYTIKTSDAHRYIRLQVTAADDGEGTPSIQSTTAVTGWLLINNLEPEIAGGVSKQITVDEDGSGSLVVNATDADSDTISFSITTAPVHGLASTTGTTATQTVSYIPEANYYGSDSFIITANDSRGGVTTITVGVTVNPVNDAPVNTSTPTVTGIMQVGQAVAATSGIWNDTIDKNAGAITYTYQWQSAEDDLGTGLEDVAQGTTLTISTREAHKYIRVKVTAKDSGIGTPAVQSTTAFSDWMPVVNIAPVIAEGSTKHIDMDVNGTISFNLNAADGDGDTTAWNIKSDAVNGAVSTTGTAASQTISYTPASRYLGSDSFTIEVSDNHGGTASTTVTVNVLDRIKPVIDLNGSPDITLEVGSVFNETVTATDNYDTDIAEKIVKTGSVNMSAVGNYTIKYNVTDSSGNRADEAERTVHVIPVVKQITLQGKITEKDTGTAIPNAAVTLKDMNGTQMAHTVTDGSGDYVFNNVILGKYKLIAENQRYSTRTDEINVVPISLTDQRMVKNLSLVNFIITLDSNPKSIIGDGVQTSTLTAAILDKDNKPMEGIEVRFSAGLGYFPGGSTAVTDKNGKCTVSYLSEKIEGTSSKLTIVRATVNDDKRDLHAYSEIVVTFDPGSVEGIVLDNDTKKPLEGALVEVSKDFEPIDGVTDFYAKMVTGPDGKYKIAVPKGNTQYDIKITKPVKVGDTVNNISYNQSFNIGNISGAGNETFDPGNSIAGLVLSKEPDGSVKLLDDYSKFSIDVFNSAGTTVTTGSLNNDASEKGVFQAAELVKGTTYTVAVSYSLGNGEKIVVGKAQVSVDSQGQTSISTILIDPYGIITDASSGKAIGDVKVTLKYADTDRNKKAGKTPDTEVNLPVISGFSPGDNKNPQMSNSLGEYAFMVFPNTDYYITGTKSGYEDYKSPTISVNDAIVQFNFSMKQIVSSGSGGGGTVSMETAISRISGQQRVDTAIAIAKAAFTGKVKNVIIATSENYPDALAGSVLAYKLQAPIVLVSSDNADQEKVMSYIKEYMDNTGTAYILGGTGAVNAQMEQKVKNSGYVKIKRLGGIDRYETAVKISKELDVKAGTPIVIASGEDYPDALSISSIAAIKQYPILLVHKDTIDDVVKTGIAGLKPGRAYIIGLQGAVSTGVENLISNITSVDKSNVVRIGGVDRYGTSLEAAKYFDLSSKIICAATGNNFPDTIAGSIYAANNNSPIILVDANVSDELKKHIKDKKIAKAVIFGGEGAVSNSIEKEFSQLISEAASK